MKSTGDWLANAARVLALALVLALPFAGGYMFDHHVLGTALWALVCALLAAAACALGSERVREGLGRAAWPLAGFIAWLVIAAFGSVYLHASLRSLVQIGSYVALIAVFASLFSDERWRRWAWVAIATAGAIEGIIGLRDWTQTVIFQGDASWRIFGTMYNPNVLASYLLMTIAAAAVVLAMAWRNTQEQPDRPRLALIGAGFAVLIGCAALLLTASRAGLLGAMFGAVVFAIAAPTRIRARWLVIAALGLIVLMVLAPPLRNRIVSATTQSHSAVFRWYTWVGTAEMVQARPVLGFGPGTWEHAHPQFARVGFTRMAHQTPLQVAAEAGLPALLLVLGGVTLIGRRLVRGLRAEGLPSLECAAGLAALAAIGMHNLADYTWYVPAVGLTLAAVAGLALAAARNDAPPPAGRRPCRVGVVLLIVATAAAGWGLRAQMLQAEGQAMLSRGRYQTAAAPLRRAAGLDPLDAGILDDLAQAVSASPLDGPQRAVPIRLQAAALNPLDAGNYLALAQLYATLGEEQSAIAAARRAVEVHPNFARAYVVLAQLQEAIGAEDEALETWRALEDVYESPVGQYQAIEDPVDISWAYAWYALGREAERQGDDDDAAQYYRRAAELTERFARSRRNNEEILREIGSWDEAEVVEAERLERQAERRLERMKERDGQ
ncbi:MAG: O-antigen ligase family protein [Armatimonadota bacterium]